MKRLNTIVIAFLLSPALADAQSANLKEWPKGASPKEVGMRVAERFLATPHTNFNRPTPPSRISYPEVCTWYGALKFARETENKQLTQKLAKRFEPLFNEEASLI